MVHGNLKASNVFVRDDDTCLLADFGRAKSFYLFSKASVYYNTPYWTAPELIRTGNASIVSRCTDVWSLGCTVYEMISKRPPWSDKKSLSLLPAIAYAEKPPEYPSAISAELRDFLNSCFQIDPAQRANVNDLTRHPFIQREKLAGNLAHLQSQSS